MVLYTCQRCLKEFDRKSNYTRHINRKNKCVKITSKNNNNQNVKNVKKGENTNHPNLGMAIPKPGCERVKIYKCLLLVLRVLHMMVLLQKPNLLAHCLYYKQGSRYVPEVLSQKKI